jgi:hypothetical protein
MILSVEAGVAHQHQACQQPAVGLAGISGFSHPSLDAANDYIKPLQIKESIVL